MRQLASRQYCASMMLALAGTLRTVVGFFPGWVLGSKSCGNMTVSAYVLKEPHAHESTPSPSCIIRDMSAIAIYDYLMHVDRKCKNICALSAALASPSTAHRGQPSSPLRSSRSPPEQGTRCTQAIVTQYVYVSARHMALKRKQRMGNAVNRQVYETQSQCRAS